MWIVTCDSDGLPIDKAVKLKWRLKSINLLNELLHLAVSQRYVIKTVDTAIVFK